MAKTGRKAETVSFRLGGSLLTRLERLGEDASPSVSRGEVAKRFAVAALQDEHQLELERRFDRLQKQVADARHGLAEEVAKLRSDLSTVLEAVLLNLTPATKEQAEEFIRTKLRR